jgi:hypothetical protein
VISVRLSKSEAAKIAKDCYFGNGYMYQVSELERAYERLSDSNWDGETFVNMQSLRDELASRGRIY